MGKTIILAEPEKCFAMDILDILRWIYRVKVTHILTSGDGMAEVLEAKPDVLVLDLSLPRCDCMQLLRSLQEPKPQVIATGYEISEAIKQELAKLNVVQFVEKPCTAKQLTDVLFSVIDGTPLLPNPIRAPILVF